MSEYNSHPYRKSKHIFLLIISSFCFITVLIMFFYSFYLIPSDQYNQALKYLKEQKYRQAIVIFSNLDGFKDSPQKLIESKYYRGTYLLNEKRYQEAYELFNQIRDYKDSKTHYTYSRALYLYFEREYNDAEDLFKNIAEFKDSILYLNKIKGINSLDGTWISLNNNYIKFVIENGIIYYYFNDDYMAKYYLEYEPDLNTFYILMYPSYDFKNTTIKIDNDNNLILKSKLVSFDDGIYVKGTTT